MADGVETIEISIYDKNNQEIGEKKFFQCSDHKGMIKDISHKTINILMLAKDHQGDVVYRGMKRNVLITHGKTNKVAITATLFIPKLDSPMKKSCTTTPILKWHKVEGASEYHLLVSDNKAMENATSYIENNESHELLDTGDNHTIFWLVQVADRQGNISQASEIFSFSTNKSLLKDITLGTECSHPKGFCDIDGVLYFGAKTTELGRELWKTDGRIIGTVLVKDINPGSDSSDCDLGFELWKSDGTEAGTLLVKDINFLGDSILFDFEIVNNILFFVVGPTELWKSDGTPEGTTLVKAFPNPEGVYAIGELTNYKDKLFFRAIDKIDGEELWVSDIIKDETYQFLDINKGSDSSAPFIQSVIGDILYFDAYSAINGSELWQSDGTPKGYLHGQRYLSWKHLRNSKEFIGNRIDRKFCILCR